MDGIHDLGGKQGFGPVPCHDAPKFTHDWEERVFGLIEVLVGDGFFNIDRFRHAVERVDPVTYLAAGYYGRWFAAAELLLCESGVLSAAEIEANRTAPREAWIDRVEALIAAAHRSPGVERSVGRAPLFSVGDRVRTRRLLRSGHCRLPAYARDREGMVVQVHPAYIYPDTHAHCRGEHPQYVYSVQFKAQELWGSEAEAAIIALDVFEPYLVNGSLDPMQ